jgi:hypothetical protein
MNSPSDKPHDGQVLDHDPFLFRRKKIPCRGGTLLHLDRLTFCPGCQLSATPYENLVSQSRLPNLWAPVFEPWRPARR